MVKYLLRFHYFMGEPRHFTVWENFLWALGGAIVFVFLAWLSGFELVNS